MTGWIAFLLMNAAFAGTGPSPGLETRLAAIFDPKACVSPAGDPLAPARAEIDRFKRERKTTTAMRATLADWLARERKTGKDVPALNWVRALNPWLLPPKFPVRTVFEECASHLRTYSDAREAKTPDAKAANDAIAQWKECVALAYNSEPPAEFALLTRCLGGK